MTPRTSTLRALAGVVVLLVAAACAPQPPASTRAGATELCVPADAMLSNIVMTVVSTPSDGTLSATVKIGDDDYYVGEDYYPDLHAGGDYPVSGPIHPGRCLHMYASGGVKYQVSSFSFSWALACLMVPGCPPGPYNGWPPGTL